MSMTYSSIWRDINWIHFSDTDSRTGIETSWSLWGNVTTIITTITITKHHHQTCTCSTEMYTWHTSVCPLGPSESLERSIVADLQLPGSRFSDPYGQVKPISKDFLEFFLHPKQRSDQKTSSMIFVGIHQHISWTSLKIVFLQQDSGLLEGFPTPKLPSMRVHEFRTTVEI